MIAGMISGARAGRVSGLRRIVARALAQELAAFVIPGPEIARARGLDLAGAGLPVAITPRQADVLLIIGDVQQGLRDAVSIVYAQMPRPRAILALGAGDLAPLPAACVSDALSQEGLLQGLAELRRAFAAGAFQSEIAEFKAPALETRIEYTCPMHPEVVSDEPGSCPKCGMTLVLKEAEAGGGHAGHGENPDTENDHSGHSTHSAHGGHSSHSAHSGHGQPSTHADAEPGKYTCPMHPEVVSDEPGSCPKCGMTLVLKQPEAGGGHAVEGGGRQHEGHSSNGNETHFMSMVDVTKNLPRSSDGLRMDWITVPFGPFFPGLPGGLGLELTLDGDTVAGAVIRNLAGYSTPLAATPMSPESFVAQMMKIMPHAPVSFSLLAVAALENAAEITADPEMARGRAGGLERERVASHLSWLADFGTQTGYSWLATRAASLQLKVQNADTDTIAELTPVIAVLIGRLKKTPLLQMRLGDIARIEAGADLTGPVARASGIREDLRSHDEVFLDLGFVPAIQTGGDALARLILRCDEIIQSLSLIAAAGLVTQTDIAGLEKSSGKGEATIETPRGVAKLSVHLERGMVVSAELETPTSRHVALIGELVAQQELGDALASVVSLDLSPWELGQETGADKSGGTHS